MSALSPTVVGWSPFHVAAMDYLTAGYFPIPLPIGKKWPPPKGIPNDQLVTHELVEQWLARDRPMNIGTVVPDGVVVIDVDDAPGQETIRELEQQHGILPKTWISFRGNPNRYHMWFRTPNDIVWPGKLGAGVDIVYRHYRYMVAPPSVHPSGAQYRWANLKGASLHASQGYLPGIEEFSDLPKAWLTLADSKGYVNRPRADLDARLWLEEYGKGKPCQEMRRALTRHQKEVRKYAEPGGLHDAVINGVWALVAEIATGHTGGIAALKRFRETFFEQAEESGRREPGTAESEWHRACIGAIEKTAIERVRQGDPCIVESHEQDGDSDRFFDPKHGLRARTLRGFVERTGRLAVGPGRIIYRHTDGLWTPDGESEIYRRTERLLGQRYRPAHASNVLSVVINREPLITDDKQDTQFLNLPNGLLDWRTGELFPHNPNVISTVRIPIPWDEAAECPVIDQFFGEVFPSDAIELAYEILGYMLFNDNPLHKAILLYGSGRNGKGTFIRLARMLVGHNNISAVTPQALDSSQFSSAQLYGKLANLVGDVDPRIFKSTEQFKQLTGGDYMMAQHKHKDPFVFRCRALMIAAFNSLPRTADTTEGFFSRWVVVPFSAFFPAGKADPLLITRLTRPQELSGLLRAAVGGLQQVIRRGSFSLPPSVVAATERFRKEADPIRGYVEDRLTVTRGRDFTSRPDVYADYAAWAATNGYHNMAATRFYEQLTTVLAGQITPAKREGERGFRGMTINE